MYVLVCPMPLIDLYCFREAASVLVIFQRVCHSYDKLRPCLASPISMLV